MTPGPAVAILCSTLAVGMAFASPASAAPPEDADHPLVQVQVDPCTGASPEEVRRLLRIELGALLVDAAAKGEDVTRVAATCRAAAVHLQVDDPVTGKSLSRLVELDVAEMGARSRLVALAVAELVAASWTELESNPTPEVRPAGPKPSARAVDAARRVVRKRVPKNHDPLLGTSRMTVVASRRAFFSESTAQWGGGMRLARDEFETIGWAMDVLAEHGETTVSLGTVSLDTLTLGASLYLYKRWSVLTFQLGAGVRLGAARLSGTPFSQQYAKAGSGIAPWGWPTSIAGLRLHPIGPLVIEAQGELGYVVLPMTGSVSGVREVTIAGPWVGAQLGFGMTI